MAFKKWQNVPEIQDAAEKLTESARRYSVLLAENTTDSKSQAIKLWASMSFVLTTFKMYSVAMLGLPETLTDETISAENAVVAKRIAIIADRIIFFTVIKAPY